MRVERLTGAEWFRAEYIGGAAFHYDALGDKTPEERLEEEGDRELACRFGAYNEDDEMVATIIFNDLPRFIYGEVLGMGGVGGVATMPHARRGGAVRRIFEVAIPWMYDQGMALSTLYPFSTAFYRKFGYESFRARGSWTLKLWDLELRQPAPEGRWRLIGHFDATEEVNEALLDRFIEVVEVTEARYPFGGKRPRDEWKRRILGETATRGSRFALVFELPDGTTEAAIHYRTEPERFVIEASGWRTGGGLLAILHYLKGVSGERGEVHALWPDELPLDVYLKELASGAVRYEMRKNAMLSVVHCERFLDHLAQHAALLWHDLGEAPITLAVYDAMEARNTGYYLVDRSGVTFERTVAQSEEDLALKLGIQGKHPELYASPAGLGLLFLGLEPAWVLRENGLIDYADKTAERWGRIRRQSAWLTDGF